MNRVFANDLVDRGSIPVRVTPKTQKMVLDAALLSTPEHFGVVAIEKGRGTSCHPRLRSTVYPENIQSDNIFISCLWLAQGPEV